jgi:hypothetical protein
MHFGRSFNVFHPLLFPPKLAAFTALIGLELFQLRGLQPHQK